MMMRIKIMLISLILSGCYISNLNPEFYINGIPYYTVKKCLKGHDEEKYGYHYGYSIMYGKFCWHLGSYSEFVCDETIIDTIKIKINE